MLLNIILTLVVLIIALLCLTVALRAFGVEKLRGVPLAVDTGLRGQRFTPSMGLAAAAWGVGVLACLYAAACMYCTVSRGALTWDIFKDSWMRWDANHYRNLAELGYHGYVEDGEHLFLVFFPLYPWLVRLLHHVIPSYELAGLALSSACYVAGCFVLAKLTTEDFGRKTAVTALGLFSAYPFAFFFGAFYTESLFLLLSVTTFYLIRRHRWLWAGLVSALAAMTRMHGMLLTMAALVEYVTAEKPLEKLRTKNWQALGYDLWRKVLPLGLVLAGVGAYLWLNYDVAGDPFKFSFYQRDHWYQGFEPLPSCLRTIWETLLGNWNGELMYTVWGPDLAMFAVGLGVLIYGVRRLPPTWAAYLLLCLLVNYSLSWPLSCGRYMACAFPLFVTVAVACRKRPMAAALLTVFSAIMEGTYLLLFLSGGPVY